MKIPVLKISVFCYTLLFVYNPYAQENSKFNFKRIEDNSFLIEEAYNQEAGVIQHISTFQYMKDKKWVYSFTQEWPVPKQRHQLSYTIPVIKSDNTGIGDVLINYRYQAILTDRLAFSPRFSLILPSGNYKKGTGNGVFGYQVNLPMSFIVSRKLVTHYNLGATYTPGAKSPLLGKSDVTGFNYGTSAILLISPTFNFMLEVAGNSTITKKVNIDKSTEHSLLINPGFRYAFNFKSGLQIVPGVAVPVGVGKSSGNYGIFLYLSFEHPLWKP